MTDESRVDWPQAGFPLRSELRQGLTSEQYNMGLELDVNEYKETVEDTNMNYLSWVHAESKCRKWYPNAVFLATQFPDVKAIQTLNPSVAAAMAKDGRLPMIPIAGNDKQGYFVHVRGRLTEYSPWHELWYNIWENLGKGRGGIVAKLDPTVNDINNAIMRAKTKLIAEITGIGFYIYAGEDIPDGITIIAATEEQKEKLFALCREPEMLVELNSGPNAGKTRAQVVLEAIEKDGFSRASVLLSTKKLEDQLKQMRQNVEV